MPTLYVLAYSPESNIVGMELSLILKYWRVCTSMPRCTQDLHTWVDQDSDLDSDVDLVTPNISIGKRLLFSIENLHIIIFKKGKCFVVVPYVVYSLYLFLNFSIKSPKLYFWAFIDPLFVVLIYFYIIIHYGEQEQFITSYNSY